MTNYIKPGSQASFEKSTLSVTKNTRHLDKMFSNAFYAKKSTSKWFFREDMAYRIVCQ